jgi:hypothetical protein
MIINIIPSDYVQTPLGGTITLLSINVNSFPLFPTSIDVTWTVTGDNITSSGVMTLPQSIVDQWGTDDTVVENYVLQQLNLIKDNSTTTTTEPPIE